MKKTIPLLIIAIMINGCAAVPYHYSRGIEQDETFKLANGERQIERGTYDPLLDGIGHYFLSLPAKIILLNWRVCNHNITDENEQILKQYLADNDLANVKIRLNQYVPLAEWSRLFKNDDVSPIFRYTLGVITLITYTIIPERLFAGRLSLSPCGQGPLKERQIEYFYLSLRPFLSEYLSDIFFARSADVRK